MAINGSVYYSDCGGDRILEVEEDYFPPTVKEYMLKELNWLRCELDGRGSLVFGWVFWSQQDHEPEPTLDNFEDFIPDVCGSPKVGENMRCALQKMILYPCLDASLVQFWAPIKTFEGRTMLTTQYQPFALGPTYSTIERQLLCEYRMMICDLYADAESGEEELGPLGRVFLNKFPESTPSVNYYSKKEYPQLDHALRCHIGGSWALPVFEHSSQTCVGVLEIVSLLHMSSFWHDISFLAHQYNIFQEFGLQCFDGYKHYEMQFRDENIKALAAFQELKMVLRSVCEIHELPLAMTWVPCNACNDLVRGQFLYEGVEFCGDRDPNLSYFLNICKYCHLRKGQVFRRALSSPNLLYCSDITQLSLDEYPLVTYARLCKFKGWFTICLQSSYTGNDIYVVEFFLPMSNRYRDILWTLLSLILGTMEVNLKNFKLASGQELGELLSIEVMDFQNGQKLHSVHMIQATSFFPSLQLLKDGGLKLQPGQLDKPLMMDSVSNGKNIVREEQNYNLPSLEHLQNGEVTTQLYSSNQPSMDPSNKGQSVITAEQNIIVVTGLEERKIKTQRGHKKTGVRIEVSFEDILKCSEMNRNNAAKKLKVSISTLKRLCRDYGIHRWPPRNIEKVPPFGPSPVENQGQTQQLNSDLPSNQASTSVAHEKPAFQDVDIMTVRAKYEKVTIKFRLPLSSKLVALQQEVMKRLNLEAGTYYVKCKDEEDELILIACDEDLQDYMHTFRSLGNTSVVVLLELKQPITSHFNCMFCKHMRGLLP